MLRGVADLFARGAKSLSAGHIIYLDANAAGWGWFVDPTPADDSEFTTPGNQSEQHRMDLLSVVMHEMGHVLGFEHSETAVMAETLAPGSRPIQASDLSSYDLVFADLARLLGKDEQHRRSS